jgi:hypothetical protein
VSTLSPRDRAALALAALLTACGLIAFLFGSYDAGISWRFEPDTGHLVVDQVDPMSQAQRDGVVPGLIP